MDFIESNMRFSLNDEDTFLIEKAKVLHRLPGVMPCECVAWYNEKLCLVEAKSSAPSPKNKQNFDKFINDIAQKFTDTILLFNAILYHRHEQDAFDELPSQLKQMSGTEKYQLFLIVHGHQDEWMKDILDALKQKMGHVLKAWNIADSQLKAINHEAALRMHLIKGCFPVEELESLKKSGCSSEDLKNIVYERLMNGDR